MAIRCKVWVMFCVFSCLSILSIAQTDVYKNEIFKQSIKTLKAYVDGNDRSYPAIELNGENKLLIQFDDLAATAISYSYQLILCNADWSPSNVFTDQYMTGFNDNIISNYEYSVNTRIPFVNYWVSLPNDDVQFKVSGNYIFKVFEGEDIEKPVLSIRFMVYETLVGIESEIIKPLGAQVQNNSQEVRLSVFHHDFEIADPFNEIKVVITQNNRPDRTITDIKPVFVKNNELVYSFSGEHILTAGNEFRTFSFSNIHKNGLYVNDIQFFDSIYHVQLRPDERRSSKRYFTDEDMNGKSFIYVDNTTDTYISADYAYVHFSIPTEPFLEGSIYVYGDFNLWKIEEKYKMIYDFDANRYEAQILLKQGYYNYNYMFYNYYTKEIDESIVEGSHFQTENDYLIYVYFKGISDDYDRLIGYVVVNSRNRN